MQDTPVHSADPPRQESEGWRLVARDSSLNFRKCRERHQDKEEYLEGDDLDGGDGVASDDLVVLGRGVKVPGREGMESTGATAVTGIEVNEFGGPGFKAVSESVHDLLPHLSPRTSTAHLVHIHSLSTYYRTPFELLLTPRHGLVHGLVEDEVEEDVETAEDPRHFSAALDVDESAARNDGAVGDVEEEGGRWEHRAHRGRGRVRD